MSILTAIAVVIQVLSAIGVIILVLLQHGKGADMGAAFGSGSSGSLFGATGSANFLSRMTAVLAAVFFGSTLVLAFVANSRVLSREPTSVMDKVPAPATSPAAPAGPASIPGTGAPAAPDGAATPAAAPAAAPSPDATQKNDGAGAIPK